MFTISDIIKRKMELKGVTVHDLYVASGFNRKVYASFQFNRFTKKFLRFVSEQIGEDVTMYANSVIDKK